MLEGDEMSRKSEIELTNMCDLAVGMAEQTGITKEFVEGRASEEVMACMDDIFCMMSFLGM